MEKFIIDRITEGIAVCENENGDMINIYDYPKDSKEGDCLLYDGKSYVVDKALTEQRRKKINSMFERLKKH